MNSAGTNGDCFVAPLLAMTEGTRSSRHGGAIPDSGPTPYTLHPTPSSLTPKALLVMVHGSPRGAANADMYRVVERVREHGVYSIVEVGFLDCNEPRIPEAIDRCVAAGAGRINAVPYFLHTGTHVAEDLPDLLDEGRARHPEVEFRMAGYLGSSPRITDILAQRALAVSGRPVAG